MTHRPLEPTTADFRVLMDRVMDLAAESLDGLDASPASLNTPTADLLDAVSAAPPEAPGTLEPLLGLVRAAAHESYQTAGPGYLAYIPGGGIVSSAAAGFLGTILNRYTGKVATAPALVAMEESVLRWLCDLFAFPATSQALLTAGGSGSNLVAVVAARTRHAAGQTDRATVYVGEHAHGSILKAARTAGLSREHVRTVRSGPDLRLDTEHLRRLVAADRAAGLIPVCICAAAGTTNTGTIDDLNAVADVAQELGVWFHIDGAYGGLFQMTERGKEGLAGIERADSITLDPHKSLFVPFGTGAVVVRDRDALQQAFAEDADYMQDLDGDTDALPDFDALSPELTREFRGLRLWLPLHLHGVAAFRDQLDEKLDLADEAYHALAADPRLEVPVQPDLTVLVFRLRGGNDAAQVAFLDRINATQRVLLSSTRLRGEVWLRMAILSARTHEDRVREALDIVAHAARASALEPA